MGCLYFWQCILINCLKVIIDKFGSVEFDYRRHCTEDSIASDTSMMVVCQIHHKGQRIGMDIIRVQESSQTVETMQDNPTSTN